MHKLNFKLMFGAIVAAAVIAGCGGGGSDDSAAAESASIGQSVTALVDFIGRMIKNTSENSDPIDVNALTLAVDDSAEPTPL